MDTVFALLCFVVVIHWLIFPYPSGLLHWHCGNLTIAPVPAKQPWWIWINTSCEFIMNDCVTTIKQSTTKPCAYFLGYTHYHHYHHHHGPCISCRGNPSYITGQFASSLAEQVVELTVDFPTNSDSVTLMGHRCNGLSNYLPGNFRLKWHYNGVPIIYGGFPNTFTMVKMTNVNTTAPIF